MSIWALSRIKLSANAETDANRARSTSASSAFLNPVVCMAVHGSKMLGPQKRPGQYGCRLPRRAA